MDAATELDGIVHGRSADGLPLLPSRWGVLRATSSQRAGGGAGVSCAVAAGTVAGVGMSSCSAVACAAPHGRLDSPACRATRTQEPCVEVEAPPGDVAWQVSGRTSLSDELAFPPFRPSHLGGARQQVPSAAATQSRRPCRCSTK
jgi:hypothetical protein